MPDTLLHPRDASSRPSMGTSLSGALPSDLIAESINRLRILALLYAFTYAMAAFVPPLLSDARMRFYGDVGHWLPGAVSIAIALAVAWLTRSATLSLRAKASMALPFEVVSSFGIAVAEYHDITTGIEYHGVGLGGFGLSWVTVWVLLFTVLVPAVPRRAVVAAALSVSAVPLVFQLNTLLGSNTVELEPLGFFFTLVFPNMLVVVMAYVGSHVVFRLGTAVRKARELGSYRLTERLGRGGMGEVWRAEHRLLARPAAVKLVRPEVLGGTTPADRQVLVKRFEREAQVTALMRSPHTMELYDFGLTHDGTFYYVMELLDGFDLDELVTRFGPVPAERAVHLLTQICESLAEAHEAGLIHRDVKPANVYVCRYGRAVDFVKVLDFGLVKQRGHAADGADKLTAEHVTGGTPAYMSPEQALSEDEIDGRSDLYAVGCLGYWLLTGSVVFQGRTPMETVVMHVQREPEPPSRRTEFPIPRDVERIIMTCLAKDRADRPHSADALRDELMALCPDHSWTPDRARQWWEMHRPVAQKELTPAVHSIL